jgi:hypothetical protein
MGSAHQFAFLIGGNCHEECYLWRFEEMAFGEGVYIDLRRDLEPIRSFLKSSSDSLAARYPDRLISGIHFAFFLPGDHLELCFHDDPKFQPMSVYEGFVPPESFYLQHWGMTYDIQGDLPINLIDLEGKMISTGITKEKLYYPDGWSDLVESMGMVLVQAILIGQGEVFDPLNKRKKLKIGVYVFTDDSFSRYLTLEKGKVVIHAEHP